MPKPNPSSRRERISEDQSSSGDEEKWIPALLEAVKTMRYGTFQIFVQDWEVSQIERTDRVRLQIPNEGGKKAPSL